MQEENRIDEFQFVLDVSDPDFENTKHKIWECAKSAETNQAEGLANPCGQNVQNVLELITKYIYREHIRRYAENEKIHFYGIITDREFKKLIEEKTSKNLAVLNQLNNIGNLVKHDIDAELSLDDAKASFFFMKGVLRELCVFIETYQNEKIPKSSFSQNKLLPIIKGQVQIQKKKNIKTGTEYLRAIIANNNFPLGSGVQYTWHFLATESNGEYSLNPRNSSSLDLQEKNYGRRVIVEVSCPSLKSGVISSKDKPFMISKDEEEINNHKLIIEKDTSFVGSSTIHAGIRLGARFDGKTEELNNKKVSFSWGTIDDTGSFVQISNGEKLIINNNKYVCTFICTLDRTLGKKYRCVITYGKNKWQADSHVLIEDDYAILGDVTINVKLVRDDDEKQIVAIRAHIEKQNYQGQPEYEWYRNGELINGADKKYIGINKNDVGKEFKCRVSHKGLTGTITSNSCCVRENDFAEYEQKLCRAIETNSEKLRLSLEVREHEHTKCIFALLNGMPVSSDEYRMKWTSKKNNSDTEDEMLYKGTHLSMKDLHPGDTVTCVAYSAAEGTSATEKAEILLRADDFNRTKEGKCVDEADATAYKSGENDSYEKTESDIERDIISVQQNNEETGERKEVRRIDLSPTVDISAPDFHCFDSNVSRLHYFIASRNELFATNSLEILDYYAFLNLLLAEQGYQRVIIISHKGNNKGDNYPVIAYDKYANITFMHPDEFIENFDRSKNITKGELDAFCSKFETSQETIVNPIRERSGGKKRGIERKNATIAYGRRIIYTIVPEGSISKESHKGTFHAFMENYVVKAMEQSVVKTAIVLPIEILQKKDYLNELVARNIRDQIESVGDNVIIVTADQKSMLAQLFDIPEYGFIEKEIYNAVSNIQGDRDAASYCNAIVDSLSVVKDENGKEYKNVRIMISDKRPGKDEIANLLLAKKIRDRDSYVDLPYSKIYSIAEYLFKNCENNERTQSAFPEIKTDNTWDNTSLATLDKELGKDEVRKAIISKANSLYDRNACRTIGWKATCLERLYKRIDVVPSKEGRTIAYSGAEIIDRDIISEKERQILRDKAMTKLNALIGLKPVKEQLTKVLAAAANPLAFKNKTGPGHYIFTGNPGTGKTTVARLVGDILHSEGVLRSGHVVEIKKADIVAEHIGGTQTKALEKFNEAIDGVLFLDEAYELVNTDNTSSGTFNSSFDEEAYTLLLKFMEDNRERVCVICAGYKDKMDKFLGANQGMKDRFSAVINFPDYSASELFEILKKDLKETTALKPTDGFLHAAEKVTKDMAKEASMGLDQFSNARSVRLLVEDSVREAMNRDPKSTVILDVDIPGKYKPVDINSDDMVRLQTQAWEELDHLIGLRGIKEKLNRKVEYSKRAYGKAKKPGHYAFVGNPGTGKTEVARLMAKILYANGLLRTDNTVEVKAGDIIGRYVGQSAPLAEEKCREALDGVLFIDEAYSMVNSGGTFEDTFSSTFAKESYETILKFMEDYRQRICVIFAGYKNQMNTFLDANPGMRSRVSDGNIIEFSDYSDDELIQILQRMADKNEEFHVNLSDEFIKATNRIMPNIRRQKGFGNARSMREYLGECIELAVPRTPYDKRVVSEDGIEQITCLECDIPNRFKQDSSETGNNGLDTKDYTSVQHTTIAPFYLKRDVIINLTNPFDSKNLQEFMDYCKQATMRVVVNKDLGTTFTITPDGYALTCAHVVMGKQFDHLSTSGVAEYLKYENGQCVSFKIPFDVVSVKQEFDLALIKLNADFALPYLKVAPKDMNVGDTEQGHLFGFPDGRPGIKYSECSPASDMLTRPSGIGDKIRYLSVRAFPGDSGGPVVLDSNGMAIGVLQGADKYSNGETLNLMKPITIADFWEQFTK